MIWHVLKDGTVLEDIQGHVVRMEEAPSIYAILDKVRERKRDKDGETYQNVACG